jgi:Zn-dependent M28 family amino/carboxypeptidase
MTIRFLRLIALATLAAVPSLLPAQSTPSLPRGTEEAAGLIDRAGLEAPVRFLSDDLLEGRGPASRGDELARLYIAHELQELGLTPAFGDSWQQPFDIVGINAEMPESWSFRGKGGEVSFARRSDFIVAGGRQSESATVANAELVFIGYGITAPEYGWDDFKGQDLRGKVLVVMNNDPDWDPKLFEGNRRLYYGRWDYKYEEGARHGAAGVIIIHTTPSAGYPFQVVQTSWTGEQFELPAGSEPRLQFKGWMTEDAIKRLFTAGGHDYAKLIDSAKSRNFKPVPLGLTTSINFKTKISRVRTANVGGVLRGRDPELNDEVVVYTAHHDHLGIGEPDSSGDRIYNGARDNAAGVAQILSVARAFKALPEPPRRSLLFLFVAAEEQGLLGSEYYAMHPTYHPGRIAANINVDSPNIWGRTTDVTIIGSGKNSLETVAAAMATKQGRTTKPDAFPDRGSYYRSDQFNFAKIGVPALYPKTGTMFVGQPAEWGRSRVEAYEQKDYHQPSDEITPEWNFTGMIEDAQLIFLVGASVAETTAMPEWNRGDEFEAARKKAIAEAEGASVGTVVPAKGK